VGPEPAPRISDINKEGGSKNRGKNRHKIEKKTTPVMARHDKPPDPHFLDEKRERDGFCVAGEKKLTDEETGVLRFHLRKENKKQDGAKSD